MCTGICNIQRGGWISLRYRPCPSRLSIPDTGLASHCLCSCTLVCTWRLASLPVYRFRHANRRATTCGQSLTTAIRCWGGLCLFQCYTGDGEGAIGCLRRRLHRRTKLFFLPINGGWLAPWHIVNSKVTYQISIQKFLP